MNTAATSLGHRNTPVSRFLLATLPVAAVAGLGSWATLPNIPTWYDRLAKPPLVPPNWVFGPVWTLLYAMMAYAVWRVLSAAPALPGRGRAVAMFFVQLGLNAIWPWAFFAGRSPAAGALNIVALDLAVLATIALFWRVDRIAALCLAPYLAWVMFATYLNLGVWRLNP